jgi:hypothetical protein
MKKIDERMPSASKWDLSPQKALLVRAFFMDHRLIKVFELDLVSTPQAVARLYVSHL